MVVALLFTLVWLIVNDKCNFEIIKMHGEAMILVTAILIAYIVCSVMLNF